MFNVILGVIGLGMIAVAGVEKVSDVCSSVKSDGVKKTVINEVEKAGEAIVKECEKYQK